VDGYFPNDHTHTSAAGANVVAAAFLKAVQCVPVANGLHRFVTNATASIQGACI